MDEFESTLVGEQEFVNVALVNMAFVKMAKEKRFYVAMAVYAGLALLVWFTMNSTVVPVGSGGVSARGVTWAILGFFAARTWLHWHAEKIRADREQNESEFTS